MFACKVFKCGHNYHTYVSQRQAAIENNEVNREKGPYKNVTMDTFSRRFFTLHCLSIMYCKIRNCTLIVIRTWISLNGLQRFSISLLGAKGLNDVEYFFC